MFPTVTKNNIQNCGKVGDIVFAQLKVQAFLEELGSNKPAPGGGTASALAGSLASSLVKMVAHLSGEEHEETISRAEVLTNQLLHLATRDTEAFNQVMAAYKLPRKTDEDKKQRSQAIQHATRLATEVPLQIMEVSLNVLALAKEMAVHGNPNTISDAGVAGLLGVAACRGASYNVLINLPGLKDQEFVAATKSRLEEILGDVEELERLVANHVTDTLAK